MGQSKPNARTVFSGRRFALVGLALTLAVVTFLQTRESSSLTSHWHQSSSLSIAETLRQTEAPMLNRHETESTQSVRTPDVSPEQIPRSVPTNPLVTLDMTSAPSQPTRAPVRQPQPAKSKPSAKRQEQQEEITVVHESPDALFHEYHRVPVDTFTAMAARGRATPSPRLDKAGDEPPLRVAVLMTGQLRPSVLKHTAAVAVRSVLKPNDADLFVVTPGSLPDVRRAAEEAWGAHVRGIAATVEDIFDRYMDSAFGLTSRSPSADAGRKSEGTRRRAQSLVEEESQRRKGRVPPSSHVTAAKQPRNTVGTRAGWSEPQQNLGGKRASSHVSEPASRAKNSALKQSSTVLPSTSTRTAKNVSTGVDAPGQTQQRRELEASSARYHGVHSHPQVLQLKFGWALLLRHARWVYNLGKKPLEREGMAEIFPSPTSNFLRTSTFHGLDSDFRRLDAAKLRRKVSLRLVEISWDVVIKMRPDLVPVHSLLITRPAATTSAPSDDASAVRSKSRSNGTDVDGEKSMTARPVRTARPRLKIAPLVNADDLTRADALAPGEASLKNTTTAMSNDVTNVTNDHRDGGGVAGDAVTEAPFEVPVDGIAVTAGDAERQQRKQKILAENAKTEALEREMVATEGGRLGRKQSRGRAGGPKGNQSRGVGRNDDTDGSGAEVAPVAGLRTFGARDGPSGGAAEVPKESDVIAVATLQCRATQHLPAPIAHGHAAVAPHHPFLQPKFLSLRKIHFSDHSLISTVRDFAAFAALGDILVESSRRPYLTSPPIHLFTMTEHHWRVYLRKVGITARALPWHMLLRAPPKGTPRCDVGGPVLRKLKPTRHLGYLTDHGVRVAVFDACSMALASCPCGAPTVKRVCERKYGLRVMSTWASQPDPVRYGDGCPSAASVNVTAEAPKAKGKVSIDTEGKEEESDP